MTEETGAESPTKREYWLGLYAGIVVGLVILGAGAGVVYYTREMPETWLWAYIVGMTAMYCLWQSTDYVAEFLEERYV